MHNALLRNTWIILKHEYLQRVRSRSFLITTLMTPVFMLLLAGIPALTSLNELRLSHQRIVVVSSDDEIAKSVSDLLSRDTGGLYNVTLDADVSPVERRRLTDELERFRIDGFIWLDNPAIESGNVTYARLKPDLAGQELVRQAISRGIDRARLAQHGVPSDVADKMFPVVRLRPSSSGGGIGASRDRSNSDATGFLLGLLFVMVLFFSLLSYGVMVMRSVMDEKASRVMEVLLCSTTPDELMAGKILGVGAVGITQVAIWAALGAFIAHAIKSATGAGLHIPPTMIFLFVVFYLLGYLLYSAMFAAVGAAFNGLDEAQQWNFLLLSPLIVSSMLMMPTMTEPNSTLVTVASMVPFCAPVLMYLRIVVGPPPTWEIIACLALMIATIFTVWQIAARVYRVGILMYGKKPTINEIIKWLRYA
jgi:ABC-2 type transport system permease protein